MNLASVNVVGVVKTVTVVVPDPMVVGDSTQLQASAKNEQNGVVAVSAGSIMWASVSGDTVLSVTADGMATALSPGTASVKATIDGVTSSAATITVNPAPIQSPTVRITWPARSRSGELSPLKGSQSAVITFKNASTTGQDVSMTVNRDPSQLAQYTQSYPVGQAISPNVSTMTATFYTLANGGGAVLGTATAAVHPNVSNLDLASIVVAGKVTRYLVVESGSIRVGASEQLHFTATDPNENIIPLTPGSYIWSIPDGETHVSITPDGVLTALATGTATVRVGGDNGFAVATFQVGDGTGIQTRKIIHEVTDLAFDSTSGKVWAAARPQNVYGMAHTIFSYDPSTGSIDRIIDTGVNPKLLAVTDDGQYIYFTSDADNSVRRLNVSSGLVEATYPAENATYIDLATVPGSPHSYALATNDTNNANLTVWDDGVKRQHGADATQYTGFGGSRIIFDGATKIYGDGGATLQYNTLAADGVVATGSSALNVTNAAFSGGLFYAPDGRVIDPVAKTMTSKYTSTHYRTHKMVAVSESDNRVYVLTWNTGTNIWLLVFNKTTGAEVRATDLGYALYQATNLIAPGNHMLTFNFTGNQIFPQVMIFSNLP